MELCFILIADDENKRFSVTHYVTIITIHVLILIASYLYADPSSINVQMKSL